VYPEIRDMRFEEFEEKFREREARNELSMPYLKKDEQEDQKLYVFFSTTTNKFTKEDLKNKLGLMKNTNSKMGLIILQGDSSVV